MARSMQQQTMGMATLKEIEQRLKSVRNIEKITKVRWDHGLGEVDVDGWTRPGEMASGEEVRSLGTAV
jgi:hypothetical protein